MSLLPDGVLPGSDFFFYTPSSVALTQLYYFTSAGRFFCDGAYSVKRDNYGNYLLLIVERGTLIVTTNGRTYSVHRGEIAFIDCHTPHSYRPLDSVDFTWLHFAGQNTGFLHKIITEKINPEPVFKATNARTLHKQMLNIIFNLKYGHYSMEYMDSLHIYELLISMLSGSAGIRPGKSDVQLSASPEVDASIRFIEEHLGEELPVSRLAEHAGLSESHFTRKFRAAMNSSPKEYVIRRRMTRAKLLLKTTNDPIKKIAFQVGFSSESHFTNTFTALNGMPPKQFRKYNI